MKAALGLLFVSCLCFMSCSKSSTTAASGATSIDQLPKATGEVATSASVSLKDMDQRFAQSLKRKAQLQLASTGQKLKDWGTDGLWTSSTSGAMCNAGNMVKNLLREAAQADKILCYMGKMVTLGKFPDSIYDGSERFVEMTAARPGGGGGGEGMNMKIKFKITTSTGAVGGVIQKFQMWSCQGVATSATEHVSEDFTVTPNQMISVGTHSDDHGSGSQRTVVTGTVNSSGVWTDKTISHASSFSHSRSSTFSQAMTLTQYADQISLNGYFTGTHSSESQTGQLFMISQILNATGLPTFAIGNGTQKFNFTFGSSSHEGLAAWNGDTLAPVSAASSDFYTDVNAGTLMTVGTPDTAFQTAEQWDCATTSPTAVTMTEADFATVMACDDTYAFGGSEGDNWVDCHSAGYARE